MVGKKTLIFGTKLMVAAMASTATFATSATKASAGAAAKKERAP